MGHLKLIVENCQILLIYKKQRSTVLVIRFLSTLFKYQCHIFLPMCSATTTCPSADRPLPSGNTSLGNNGKVQDVLKKEEIQNVFDDLTQDTPLVSPSTLARRISNSLSRAAFAYKQKNSFITLNSSGFSSSWISSTTIQLRSY